MLIYFPCAFPLNRKSCVFFPQYCITLCVNTNSEYLKIKSSRQKPLANDQYICNYKSPPLGFCLLQLCGVTLIVFRVSLLDCAKMILHKTLVDTIILHSFLLFSAAAVLACRESTLLLESYLYCLIYHLH